ncbi:MAG: hypothetical protein U5K56_02580 [Halioglobus sp.]|nr:hypothetical protein [Halioglobus sp.]
MSRKQCAVAHTLPTPVGPRGMAAARLGLLLLCVAALSGAAPAGAAVPATEKITRQGRTLELRISPGFEPDTQKDLRSWILFVAQALEQVYGHWPGQRWLVTVEPLSAPGSDPIPWARVHRDNPDRVEFFVSPRATAGQLREAWTGYHEMAHLLLPYRGWGDAWFSEGLATYYQNVLRARAGVLDERAMWQAMYEGFRRGSGDGQFNNQTLSSASDRMSEQGGYRRVYWSGAWYFLMADARLRRQSGGELDLDAALGKLNACCAGQRMSVEEMVAKLDRLNRIYLFQPLYEKVRKTTAMPEIDTLFTSLGIALVDDRVVLQQEGAGARLRRQIATPRAM